MNLYQAFCRLGAGTATFGAALLPLVDRSPNNWERSFGVVAVLAGLVLVVSVVRELRPRVVDYAATLAAFLLFTDGWESILSHEQRTPSIWRTVLLTWAGGVMALAVMYDAKRQERAPG